MTIARRGWSPWVGRRVIQRAQGAFYCCARSGQGKNRSA